MHETRTIGDNINILSKAMTQNTQQYTAMAMEGWSAGAWMKGWGCEGVEGMRKCGGGGCGGGERSDGGEIDGCGAVLRGWGRRERWGAFTFDLIMA